jgi:uncharacterized protein (TIGR02145 family)
MLLPEMVPVPIPLISPTLTPEIPIMQGPIIQLPGIPCMETRLSLLPRTISNSILLTYGTVTDIDGNVYRTVSIGTQAWMAENLRTTHYQNGDALPNVREPGSWLGSGNRPGTYCYYLFDEANAEIYGAYYNWAAASDPRNLAPEGWHLATEEDWKTLQGYAYATYGAHFAAALREPTTAHWNKDMASNPMGTNASGFTALAADRAFTLTDSYWYKGNYGYFWTSSGSADLPVYALLRNDLSLPVDQNLKGFNIRCVKNKN